MTIFNQQIIWQHLLPHSKVKVVSCGQIAFFSNSTIGLFLQVLLQLGNKWTPIYIYSTKKVVLASFWKISIVFQILYKNSEIFIKTPQVQVATNHTNKTPKTKVRGVLKTFWIDLLVPSKLIIHKCTLYCEKIGQSWVKFNFFSFSE